MDSPSTRGMDSPSTLAQPSEKVLPSEKAGPSSSSKAMGTALWSTTEPTCWHRDLRGCRGVGARSPMVMAPAGTAPTPLGPPPARAPTPLGPPPATAPTPLGPPPALLVRTPALATGPCCPRLVAEGGPLGSWASEARQTGQERDCSSHERRHLLWK